MSFTVKIIDKTTGKELRSQIIAKIDDSFEDKLNKIKNKAFSDFGKEIDIKVSSDPKFFLGND